MWAIYCYVWQPRPHSGRHEALVNALSPAVDRVQVEVLASLLRRFLLRDYVFTEGYDRAKTTVTVV